MTNPSEDYTGTVYYVFDGRVRVDITNIKAKVQEYRERGYTLVPAHRYLDHLRDLNRERPKA